MNIHPLFAGFKGESPYAMGAALGFAIHVETALGPLPTSLDQPQRARMREGGDLAGFHFAGGWGAPGAHCLMFAKPLTRMAATWWRAGEADAAVALGALAPCAFCGGPPVADIYQWPHNLLLEQEDYGDDGVSVEAFVSCHECGAKGPEFEGVIYDRADYLDAIEQGKALWNTRDARHAGLFVANQALADDQSIRST